MVVMVSKDDSKSFSPGSSPGRATKIIYYGTMCYSIKWN